jgi:murein DD-endopeptidase MepM/ murein hydrolase activator NlpD
MRIKLLNILKKELSEQYWGLAWKDTLSDESKKKSEEVDAKKITKNTLNNVDINSTFLIEPSKERGSAFNEVRGTNKDGTPKLHKGIDYRVGVGTLVVLIKPGVVLKSGMNLQPTGYGALIEIEHEDGVITRYGHMSEIYVSAGDKINSGDIIGATGGEQGAVGAGNSTGPHLHFEYRVGGTPIDPSSSSNDNSVYRFMNKSDKPKLGGGRVNNSVNNNNSGNNNNSVNNNNSGNKSPYILGKKMVISPNGPRDHGTRPLGNWQSDNATDIFGTPGTVVYSITKGRVSKIGGNQNNHKGKIYGAQITIEGYVGYTNVFYTHLQNVMVKVGQEVKLGTPLAEISLWETSPSGSHVHVGLQTGSLNDLLNLKTGEIK